MDAFFALVACLLNWVIDKQDSLGVFLLPFLLGSSLSLHCLIGKQESSSPFVVLLVLG